MRRRSFVTILLCASPATALAQTPLLDTLTQTDARRGLRDALGLAALNATARLGQPSGFWNDGRVRIGLPGLLGRSQRSLRPLGLSGPLDALQQSLNHAAEAAMPEASRLFVAAVRDITIADAIEIVRGPQDGATRYLRARTQARLSALLRPAMTRALTQSGAFALMRAALREIGLAGVSADVRAEVIDFAAAKALEGCFFFIAEEERAIRRDPLRRTSDILRRVFGQG